MIRSSIFFLKYLWSLPSAVLLKLTYWFCSQRCGSFSIVDPARNKDQDAPDFYGQIELALQFIRERDPRRMRWIEKHIRLIINAPLIHWGGQYGKDNKSCYVNYPSYYQYVVGQGELSERAQQVLTMELATIIVHEATHGRVEDAGIRYRGERRERIEMLCRRQEIQFLERAVPSFQDLLGNTVNWEAIRDFESCRSDYEKFWERSDWTCWEEDWHRTRSHWRHFRNTWLRRKKRKRKAKVDTSWQAVHNSFCEAARDSQPFAAEMLYARGSYYAAAKNHDEALDVFRWFLSHRPDYRYVRQWVVSLLYDLRQWQEALPLCDKAYEKKEKYAASWKAAILMHLGRYEDSLDWIEREVDFETDSKVIRLRGRILSKLQRYEEALQCYDQGLLEEGEVELGSDEFSLLAERVMLLRELDKTEKYQIAYRELNAIRHRWWEGCDIPPTRVQAFVVKTRPEIFEPGLLCSQAYLFVCPDAACLSEPRAFLAETAERLENNLDSSAEEYDALYLRSLLHWNEDYPWREVPESLTGGKQVFVVDMYLDRLFLPDETLTGNYVDCLLATRRGEYTAHLYEKDNEEAIA